MRKLVFVLICCVLFSAVCVKAAPAEISVSARAAILIDARDGSVLYEKNADEELPMASTTKIMTALLTLERAEEEDAVITVTEEGAAVEGSSMGLLPGYRLRLSDLAVGMLLASGNDAANTAALVAGGSLEAFAALMNERAAELHMEHTHFVTPSGLDSEGHYSTARDMARLGRAALRNAAFARIVASEQLSVDFTEPAFTTYYSNHNKLLQLCEGCVGIKTGYTKKAGRCLVSAAERNGVPLIAVTLNAPDDWNDHLSLYEYGFSLYEEREIPSASVSVSVVGGEVDAVPAASSGFTAYLTAGQTLSCAVEKEAFFYAPVEKNACLGRALWYLGDTLLCEEELRAEASVAYLCAEREKSFWEKLADFFGKKGTEG